MWLVELVTVVEHHPYLFFTLVLIAGLIIRFFWKEYRRPSYQEQRELEQLLKGFEKIKGEE